MLIKDFESMEKVINPVTIRNADLFKPVTGFSIDSRTIKKGQAYIALKGKLQDGHKYIADAVKKGAAMIIAEKYVPVGPRLPFYIVKDSYAALRSAVKYVREIKNPVIYAVTGSVGKTTTKEMLAFLLSLKGKTAKNYKTENNLLGVAKTMFRLAEEKVLVLELGTNAPGEIRDLVRISRPDVGIITFVKPVHLEGLKSIEGIYREKTSLLKGSPGMKIVLNRDDAMLKRFRAKNIYWFGMDKTDYVYAQVVKKDLRAVEFLVQGRFKLRLAAPFEGFIYNALAALAAARLAGIALSKAVAKLNRFNGFPDGRMEISRRQKFTLLNDAYNANPYSVACALSMVKRYPCKKIAVLGDMRELGSKSIYYHRQLAQSVVDAGLDWCLLKGEQMGYLAGELKKAGYEQFRHFTGHAQIAKFIKKVIDGSADEYLIFLKGSRLMGLEKVARLLEKKR